jgi:AcrR family transcriptional regulator
MVRPSRRPGARPARRYDGDGVTLARLEDLQRARIVSAMFVVSGERGAGRVTVADVVERAGVSRRTFYEIFSDGEDCFLAAFDDAIARIAAVLVPAYEAGGRTPKSTPGRTASWHERIRGALSELLGLFDEQPGVARLAVVESLAAGPRAMERRNRVLARAIVAVDEGRLEVKGGSEPPPLTAEGVVGAVVSILYARLTERDHGPLIELTSPLMATIVLPYLGPAAARRELARPAPAPREVRALDSDAYQFHELGMRLTYRTLRVLDAVASHPGASNRQVGEAAGIADQGQISKLLARLRRLGLLSNRAGGDAPAKGEPNRWTLTPTGEQVAQTFRTHAVRARAPHDGGQAGTRPAAS